MIMLTIHVRINDETGRPTPVRVRITGPNGEYYPPLGRFTEVPIGRNEMVGGNLRFGRDVWAYVDGAWEMRLPVQVPLLVEALKGPEYEPLRQTVTLGAGQMALRLTLKRFDHIPMNGWYSGDGRAHCLSPHDAHLEARAEGLAIVNLLAGKCEVPCLDGRNYFTIPNLNAFSGQQPIIDASGSQIVVGTHNTHPVLGRLSLLHTHRVVHPITFGDIEETDDWSLGDWCDQCHRKKGLVVWTHAFRSDSGLIGGEALVNLILGKVDAIEYDANEKQQGLLASWYRLLNAGFRLPLIGSSGKDSNRIALGGMRTYARIPNDTSLTYSAWIEAVRAGRTFITNGPMLSLNVEGENPIRVRAEASSHIPFDRIDIIVNGEVVGHGDSVVEIEYSMPNGGWIAARCWGMNKSLLQPTAPIFAHTSPLYIQPLRCDATVQPWLRDCVERTREWITTHGNFTSNRWKDNLIGGCEAALNKLDTLTWA